MSDNLAESFLPQSFSISWVSRARAQEFLSWAKRALNAPTLDEKQAGMRQIRDYLIDEINSRRARPSDDTLSGIANGEIDGRPITIDEATGCAVVLFLGGLDTVANQLGLTFRQLAEDQEFQALLRNEHERIPKVNEELLRFFSAVTLSCRAVCDVDIAGVTIKAGDTVCCSLTLANRDDKELPSRMCSILQSRHVATLLSARARTIALECIWPDLN